ncbi:alpha/beta hydrolase [Pelagibacterium halotolerans]|uniref:Serine aminopeptidase S33 domain-containing protein n=1 Tax=Pelagibacterium halotolerans (strain DSM 22347 / JCM 15775 / CGMCC 1.7692 / B2) TaxID=1082931 RepID=G4R9Y2_PELHB|nr:alpha/beta hydrolase [Pelagibacterium halotolerans]AEQ52509.1 hypothetical protein KKY_2501 [Pelagibacterium halotolerans B2]QJR17769.1 alpha/beta hydrolase [Pelagibacterium halotolerans]SEA38548.1 hypothetical protein SAMN05428936_103250 [Pelagibacterium halotolerans]
MLKKIAIGVLVFFFVVYCGLLAYLYVNQRAFFFNPSGETFDPIAVGLDAEIVTIPTGDDEIITGWYAPPSGEEPTILYLKGNSGSFSAEYERFLAFAAAGYGLLSVDYRGFPLSPGEITQDNILTDAMGAFDWLARREDQIVIWGRSLGASPAVWVASQREAGALLLETPFYSAVNVAAERYPFAPVAWLMLDQFRSNDWIGAVEEPVFVAHGTADMTVSVSNGERLYGEAPNPYDIWIEEGADHSDLWARGIWERAQAFFAETARGG